MPLLPLVALIAAQASSPATFPEVRSRCCEHASKRQLRVDDLTFPPGHLDGARGGISSFIFLFYFFDHAAIEPHRSAGQHGYQFR